MWSEYEMRSYQRYANVLMFERLRRKSIEWMPSWMRIGRRMWQSRNVQRLQMSIVMLTMRNWRTMCTSIKSSCRLRMSKGIVCRLIHNVFVTVNCLKFDRTIWEVHTANVVPNVTVIAIVPQDDRLATMAFVKIHVTALVVSVPIVIFVDWHQFVVVHVTWPVIHSFRVVHSPQARKIHMERTPCRNNNNNLLF